MKLQPTPTSIAIDTGTMRAAANANIASGITSETATTVHSLPRIGPAASAATINAPLTAPIPRAASSLAPLVRTSPPSIDGPRQIGVTG